MLLKYIYSFLNRQANRGFARLQLCTNEDGNTNNLVLYMVRNLKHKKGGERSAGYGLKEKERSMEVF